MSRSRELINVIAFVASSLCVIPFLLSDKFSPFDPSMLDDWDEPLYLGQLRDSVSRLSEWNSGTLGLRETFFPSRLPHEILDPILASAISAPGMSLFRLGILLDWICVFLSILAFYKLFLLFVSHHRSAAIAACCAVFFPWLGSISAYIQLPTLFNGHLQTLPHGFFPSTPANRGIYTQLSFPVVGYTLALFVTELFQQWRSKQKQLWIGLLAGGLLYFYFFAWATILALILLIPIFEFAFLHPHAPPKATLRAIVTILTSAAVVSTPGLLVLFNGTQLLSPGPIGHPFPAFPFSKYYFFSPIDFGVLVIAVGALFLFRRDASASTNDKPGFERRPLLRSCCFIAALMTGELVLMNAQPVLNRWLVPYHFPLFYLHPLLSATLAGTIADRFSSDFSRRMLLGCTLLIAIVLRWQKFALSHSQPSDWRELRSTLSELAHPRYAGKKIATMPFDVTALGRRGNTARHLLLPYWVKMFTPTIPLAQFVGFAPDREKLVRTELFLGTLFTGEPALLGPCPSSGSPGSQNDIFSGANTFANYQRWIDCSIAHSPSSHWDACLLTREFEVGLALLDRRQDIKPPQWWNDIGTPVWKSTAGTFEIWEIHSGKLRDRFCEAPPSEQSATNPLINAE